MMEQLGVTSASASLITRPAPKAFAPKKKRRKVEAVVRRRSSRRTAGQAPVNYTTEKLLDDQKAEEEAIDPVKLLYGAEYYEHVAADHDAGPLLTKSLTKHAKEINALKIDSSSAIKLVDERIVSLCFMPVNTPIVVAGDKKGQLGVWRYGQKGNAINTYRVCKNVISKIAPSSSSNVFLTTYDGNLYTMELEKGKKSIVFNRPGLGEMERRAYSFSTPTPNDPHGVIGYGDGIVACFDQRCDAKAKSKLGMFQAHDKGLRSVHYNPANTHYIATASLDKLAKIWDIRKLGDLVATFSESSCSVSSAYFSQDGERLLTTCMDHQLRVYHNPCGGGEPDVTEFPHNNHTGRWLTKFQAVWDPQNDDCFFIGSMQHPRQIEMYCCGKPGKKGTALKGSKVAKKVVKEEQEEDKENDENAGRRGGRRSGRIKQVKEEKNKNDSHDDDDDSDDKKTKKSVPLVFWNKTKSLAVTKLGQIQDEDYLGSVQSLIAVHPTKQFLVGGNSSGRVHLFM